MNRSEKENAVEVLNNKFTDAKFVSLVMFQGLNVEEISSLRHELRAADTEFSVIKNTLARRAIQGTALTNIEEHFSGPTAVALSSQDPVAPAKILTQFIKDNPKVTLKSGLLEGKVLSQADILNLSKLPSREILLSIMLGTLKSPPSGLVNTLSGIMRKFLGTLQAIEQEKTKTST